MKSIVTAAAVLAVVIATGCKREAAPVQKTAADYEKQIQDVKANEKMPPNIKQMVLGQLENQKRQAESKSKGG